jgi:6-phosphogluconolactonase
MDLVLKRRHAAKLLALGLAAASMGAPALATDERGDRDDDDHDGAFGGHLFISTNSAAGNEVLVFRRAGHGPASFVTRAATQGLGTGAGLGSQGAVTLSGNGRYLFVVNAGSNTLATFALTRRGLALRSVVDTGGLTPTSVTENDGLVYVLNAGGSGGVAGFRNVLGRLAPVPGGLGTLSAATGTAPG